MLTRTSDTIPGISLFDTAKWRESLAQDLVEGSSVEGVALRFLPKLDFASTKTEAARVMIVCNFSLG